MTKKVEKSNGKIARKQVADTLPVRKLMPASEARVELRKIFEISELLWLPESLGEEEGNARIIRALDLYEELRPVGSAESMLAAQMVGTHSAALECLRRAAIPNQTHVGRDMALKHAQKLMALYTNQLAALDKHRGKGQQKVTVEHVHVHPGGQAVVGNLEMGQRHEKTSEKAEAVEHLKDVSEPVGTTKKKTFKSRRSD